MGVDPCRWNAAEGGEWEFNVIHYTKQGVWRLGVQPEVGSTRPVRVGYQGAYIPNTRHCVPNLTCRGCYL